MEEETMDKVDSEELEELQVLFKKGDNGRINLREHDQLLEFKKSDSIEEVLVAEQIHCQEVTNKTSNFIDVCKEFEGLYYKDFLDKFVVANDPHGFRLLVMEQNGIGALMCCNRQSPFGQDINLYIWTWASPLTNLQKKRGLNGAKELRWHSKN